MASQEKIGPPKRIFLRVPLRSWASILVSGKFFKKVKLADLNSKGLSFIFGRSEAIPEDFEIVFSLGRFSKPIRAALKVKNRFPARNGTRIGCAFSKILDEDLRRVEGYILRSLNISLPVEAVNLAAFLCVMDAGWRILAYFLLLYYGDTPFGREAVLEAPSIFYALTLAAYLVFALWAFMLSCASVVIKNKVYFFLSLFFLGCIFIFALAETFFYLNAGLWYSPYRLVKVFWRLWIGFVGYLGFAIALGVLFLKKIHLTMGILTQQFKALVKT
jgi:hypothetical protein